MGKSTGKPGLLQQLPLELVWLNRCEHQPGKAPDGPSDTVALIRDCPLCPALAPQHGCSSHLTDVCCAGKNRMASVPFQAGRCHPQHCHHSWDLLAASRVRALPSLHCWESWSRTMALRFPGERLMSQARAPTLSHTSPAPRNDQCVHTCLNNAATRTKNTLSTTEVSQPCIHPFPAPLAPQRMNKTQRAQ